MGVGCTPDTRKIRLFMYDGDNVDYQIDQSQSQSGVLVSENVLISNSDFVVTSKPKRGRARKSGRALEAVTEITTKNKNINTVIT